MFRVVYIFFFLICCIPTFAQTDSIADSQKADSVEFYLLTCYPGREVYSLYGHTAIRYHNFSTSQDITFNYGIFNFRQKNFVIKFAFGETYYELGAIPFSIFLATYEELGRKVVAQRLNLTTNQKKTLFLALCENAKPENKTYLYNFLFDNCCTRARDIIYGAINSDSCSVVNKQAAKTKTLTWRNDLHTYSTHNTWAETGNDLALGAGADRLMVGDEDEFLPLNLLKSFFNSRIVYSLGEEVPLVLDAEVLYEGSDAADYTEPYPSPLTCCIILAVILILVTLIEFKYKRHLIIVDRILYILLGLAGCLLFVLAISRHPLTGYNLNMLLFNPLLLVAAFFIGKQKFRKAMAIYFFAVFIILSPAFFTLQEIPAFSIILSAIFFCRTLTHSSVLNQRTN